LTFYAKLIIQANDSTLQIDSRTSDAINMAVRNQVPIYIEEDVLNKAGYKPTTPLDPKIIRLLWSSQQKAA
jgi:bifunctional DNase/RNase